MNNSIDFADRTHIEKIREHLWNGREFGQAAVMIGSGFSRNAKRVSSKTPQFPLWQDLAKMIYSELYPDGNFSQDNSKDPILLATEYKAVHKRQSLNKLILKFIPDKNYEPGKLHKLLLTLPWSDIFTTNYDTLLERTMPYIYERSYDPVLTQEDISDSMKPRIVKLHGSFPSHCPFIITEEDYRTYPRKFAPFVNLVQESIMENIFCLIGFSGDDPNFIKWSGWVRDNLGDSAPPIYLCGLLELRTPQKQVLQDRKVTAIDLSPLFPKSEFPNPDVRYKKAVEWFLLNLLSGESPDKQSWPSPSAKTHKVYTSSKGFPKIPTPKSGFSPLGKVRPESGELSQKQLIERLEEWKNKRLEYPGWIIAPRESREKLWEHTKYWIEPILENINELSPPDDLFLLYELNWRLEKTLTPLFISWIKKIIPVINVYNPYPQYIEYESENQINPNKNEYEQLNWEHISKCWVQLVFALAREAREDLDRERFERWLQKLEKIIEQKTEWKARWFYEKCLFSLFEFNQDELKSLLKEWPEENALPFWEVKRASILAELGLLDRAESLGEESLEIIRKQIDPYNPNYSLLSREGWAMVLLKFIKYNSSLNPVSEYRDRWEKLGSFSCNPWVEIRLSSTDVNYGRRIIPEKETKKKFDPGEESIKYNFLSDISAFRPAFAFLRMFEEGALPMRSGLANIFSEEIANASRLIEANAPFWAFSSMVRGGKKKDFLEWINRVNVATLPQAQVNQLYKLRDSLNEAIKDLVGDSKKLSSFGSSFSQRQVLFLSELISRLCFRFSVVQVNKIYKLTVDMYKAALFQHYSILHKCVDVLFKRLLYVMPQPEILKRMPELLSLPIPEEDSFEVKENQLWPEPFKYIKWIGGAKLESNFNRSNWTKPISSLMKVVETGTPEARKRSVLRLIRIYEIGGLSNDEIKDFGKALWAKIDPNTELPSDTSLSHVSFLILPEKDEGKAKEKLRKYLLSGKLPKIIQYSISPEGKKSFQIGFSSSFYSLTQQFLDATLFSINYSGKEERRFIDWTTQEAIQILEQVSIFWNNQKIAYKEAPKSVLFDLKENFREQFPQIMKLMAHIILPRLKDVDEKTKAVAKNLLNEMDQENLVTLTALPMILFVDSNRYEEIVRRIRFGLNSLKEKEVYGSISGLFYWLIYSRKKQIPVPPDDLLDKIVNKVLTRCQPGLNFAIGQVSVIIKEIPECFDDIQIESLCISLEYLIKETEIPDRRIVELSNESALGIPISDRPEYRKLTAELALQLCRLFKSRKKDIPEVLNKWREISQNDPLPEVRRVWSNN
jgi:hypothetical protein